MQKYFGLILGALIGFAVVACGGSGSDANAGMSDVTRAEFDALVERVKALEDRANSHLGLTGNVLTASANTATTGMQKAAAAVGDICSVLTYTPTESFPGSMESVACKSSTGYLLTMPITTSTDTVRPGMLDDARVFFETQDCSGQPYVFGSQLGDMAKLQGAVFSAYTGEDGTFYIPADATFETHSLQSYYEFVGTWNCVLDSLPEGVVTPALANDPEKTGIEDTYTGPVTMF